MPQVSIQILGLTGGLAAATAVFAIAFAWALLRSEEPASVLRYVLEAPIEVGSVSIFGNQIAISPDGRQIAYVGRGDGDGSPAIYLRNRSRLEPQRLTGSEGASQPFFAPDGTRIGFITVGALATGFALSRNTPGVERLIRKPNSQVTTLL